MGSHEKTDPTPVPSGPALVRPTVGLLLLSLGGTAFLGCKHQHGDPPMIDYPPMAEEAPPMAVSADEEPVEVEPVDEVRRAEEHPPMPPVEPPMDSAPPTESP